MTIDYTYQIQAANKVLENALDSNYIASVLAACPSSGKTTISHICINKYLDLFPDARILVLTEGQNLLKNQYLNELETPNIPINFTFGSLNSTAQVRVGIPQNIKQLKWDKIDLLIVDECHHWYLKNTDQKIIKTLQPKHQIIMTGSPTLYNKHNQTKKNKYGIHYISAEELQKHDVFSAVDLDIIKVTHKNDISTVWNDLMLKSIDLSKVMIACSSILQANTIAWYLRKQNRKVIVSTSDNDQNSLNIEDFKSGKYDTLVVVNRGILGFNDKMITTLIDMKESNNVDSNYQLFARILRNHPNNITKKYFRISCKNHNQNVIMLHKMVALMKRDNFKRFTGKFKVEMR